MLSSLFACSFSRYFPPSSRGSDAAEEREESGKVGVSCPLAYMSGVGIDTDSNASYIFLFYTISSTLSRLPFYVFWCVRMYECEGRAARSSSPPFLEFPCPLLLFLPSPFPSSRFLPLLPRLHLYIQLEARKEEKKWEISERRERKKRKGKNSFSMWFPSADGCCSGVTVPSLTISLSLSLSLPLFLSSQ